MAVNSVFLSYSRKDVRTARTIRHILESAGVKVWMDTDRIKMGDTFPKEISKGLHDADKVLLLLSENSMNSPWVRAEAEQARSHDKTMLPVLLDDVTITNDFELLISGWQRLSAKRYIGRKDAVALLSGVLGVHDHSPPLILHPASWSVRAAIGVVLVTFVLLGAGRVDTIEVQMDIMSRGVELSMNDPTKALFEESLSLSSLIVSGFDRFMVSSNLNLTDEVTRVSALEIVAQSDNYTGTSGRIAMNLDLAKMSEIRLFYEEGEGIIDFFIYNLGKSSPDISISGAVQLVPLKKKRHEAIVEQGLITFVSEEGNSISFELEMDENDPGFEVRNRNLNGLSLQLVDLPAQVEGDRPESMLLGGTIAIGEGINRTFTLKEGQEIRYGTLQGNLQSLKVEDAGIHLVFSGYVTEATIGSGNSQQSIMPRRYERWIARFMNTG